MFTLLIMTLLFTFVGSSSHFALLLKEVRKSQQSAFAEGTNSNLRSQFRGYFAYCIYFRRVPLPADLDTVCGYAQFLSRSVKHPTILNYLSGLKMLHIILGHPYPFTGDAILRLLLRGLHRLHPHTPDRAPPITPQILLQVFRSMDHQSSLECCVFSCGLFIFFSMSRVGSILPKSPSTSPDKFLTKKRVNLCSPDVMVVTLLHTKTIQFGERILHIPLIRSDTPLCPVSAYQHAELLLRAPDRMPAFAFRAADSSVSPLTSKIFVDVFRSLLTRARVPLPSSYRGHSFRRGGASWAFNNGVPGELIQVIGDWKSEAYKVYLEFSMNSKIFIAQQLSAHLPTL